MRNRTWVNTRRRTVLVSVAGAALLGRVSTRAQEMVRLYVGFPPGGATDLAGRVLASALSDELGRTVIVENRSGASGTLAIRPVENSAPTAQEYALYPTLTMLAPVLSGQDPGLDKVTPIAMLYEQFSVLTVNPQVAGLESVYTLKDLVDLARASPTPLIYAINSVGSAGHLLMEWICSLAGITMQYVAYRGGAPALVDFLAGHVGIYNADSTTIAPHIRSGKLRAIAIAHRQRQPGFPGVPTVAEQGFEDVSSVPWVVLLGPPKMPQDALRTLSEAVRRALAQPELVKTYQENNLVAKFMRPEETLRTMQRDLHNWTRVIRENGIRQ